MVGSIGENRNNGTGPVVRALREFIALALTASYTSSFEEPRCSTLPAVYASFYNRSQCKRDKLCAFVN